MSQERVDPFNDAGYALEGRIVTMDHDDHVLDHGRIYIRAGKILDALPASEPAPQAYSGFTTLRTRGTIYPGLIDLHNHLSYDALTLWDVPATYGERDDWARATEYRRQVALPMGVLARHKEYITAIVRYVECKCLLGGVTTSQGIGLKGQNLTRYYRGVVRNVESGDDTGANLRMPPARDHLRDVEATDAAHFLQDLKHSSCLLLHLSEGANTQARERFTDLRLPNSDWAITDALAGIHCAALTADDFAVLSAHGASMVWSPLSNLLLYGQTANIRAALDSGVTIGLGPDWSPTGSKNLLGELKVAHVYCHQHDLPIDDHALVSMATKNAARILKWEQEVGSIERGKQADLLVVDGQDGDPYSLLIQARETAISLVTIGGVRRYGRLRLMADLGAGTEPWRVGDARRMLNLRQEFTDAAIPPITLEAARDQLRDGLRRIPELAQEAAAFPAAIAPEWTLLLDQEEARDAVQRTYFREGAAGLEAQRASVTFSAAAAAAIPLQPLALDPLTVADDADFLPALKRQRNLPPALAEELSALY